MKSVSRRLIRNLCYPFRLYDWRCYQASRCQTEDCLLIVLPGVDTHWLRTMLARALVLAYDLPEDISTISPPDLIPTFLDKTERFKYNLRFDVPRIQHSHTPYNALCRRRRVVFFIQDLRDTLVSHHCVYRRRMQDTPFSRFLRGDDVDPEGAHTLESQIAFLNGWTDNRDKLQDFTVLRYEDLKDSLSQHLQSVLFFIGFRNVTESLIEKAVNFEDLESRECRGRVDVGDFKDYFSGEDRAYFMNRIDVSLKDSWGYDYSQW